jgi:hypothetical protein
MEVLKCLGHVIRFDPRRMIMKRIYSKPEASRAIGNLRLR